MTVSPHVAAKKNYQPIKMLHERYFTSLHFTSLHSTPLHSTPLHSTPLHSTPLHSTPLHSTPLHSTSLHFTSLHFTSLYFTLHYSIPYNKFHYPGALFLYLDMIFKQTSKKSSMLYQQASPSLVTLHTHTILQIFTTGKISEPYYPPISHLKLISHSKLFSSRNPGLVNFGLLDKYPSISKYESAVPPTIELIGDMIHL